MAAGLFERWCRIWRMVTGKAQETWTTRAGAAEVWAGPLIWAEGIPVVLWVLEVEDGDTGPAWEPAQVAAGNPEQERKAVRVCLRVAEKGAVGNPVLIRKSYMSGWTRIHY